MKRKQLIDEIEQLDKQLSLRLDIRSPEERLELSLFGTNVTDADYFVGGTDFTASAGTARYDLGRPREFGASLKYNF